MSAGALWARLPTGEVLRFGVVGVTATLVHFGVLNAAVRLAGLDPVIANGIAFSVAVFVTYVGQSLWVFRQPIYAPGRLQKFATSAVGGLVANMALMALFSDLFGLHYNIAFGLCLIIVPGCQFVVNKLWVFGATGARTE